jgi:hypothetical protein
MPFFVKSQYCTELNYASHFKIISVAMEILVSSKRHFLLTKEESKQNITIYIYSTK